MFQFAPRSTWGVGTPARYVMSDQIGQGTYGKVYRGVDTRTGEPVALKKMERHHESEGFPRTETREIKILAGMRHVNMVLLKEIVASISVVGLRAASSRDREKQAERVLAAQVAKSATGSAVGGGGAAAAETESVVSFEKMGDVYMVFEYVDYDLAGLLESGFVFEPLQVKVIVAQLLRVLDALHASGVVHRDLKTANVLLCDDFTVKLADFGLSRTLPEDRDSERPLSKNVITLWYRPPELLLGTTQYNASVDLWSVGCVLLELLSGNTPFRVKSESEAMRAIFSVFGTPPEDSELRKLPYWSAYEQTETAHKTGRFNEWLSTRFKVAASDSAAANLVSRLLEPDPSKRISARDALNHRYFNELPSGKPATTSLVGAHSKVSLSRTFTAGVDLHEFALKDRAKKKQALGDVDAQQPDSQLPPPQLPLAPTTTAAHMHPPHAPSTLQQMPPPYYPAPPYPGSFYSPPQPPPPPPPPPLPHTDPYALRLMDAGRALESGAQRMLRDADDVLSRHRSGPHAAPWLGMAQSWLQALSDWFGQLTAGLPEEMRNVIATRFSELMDSARNRVLSARDACSAAAQGSAPRPRARSRSREREPREYRR